MNQEPLTLYKLIVLYLLNKVSFPLTMAQVSDLILEKEYTSYLTLQQGSAGDIRPPYFMMLQQSSMPEGFPLSSI